MTVVLNYRLVCKIGFDFALGFVPLTLAESSRFLLVPLVRLGNAATYLVVSGWAIYTSVCLGRLVLFVVVGKSQVALFLNV